MSPDSSRQPPLASSRSTPQGTEPSTAERLRHVALELFAQRGYSGTSLAQIAQRLGIRKPSLYNYYRSKDELFLELFEDSLERWRAASMAPLSQPGACEHRLKAHLQASLELAVQDPHATALCRAAVAQVDGETAERVRTLLDRYHEEYRQVLEDIFSAAIESGDLPAHETGLLVLAWLAFKDGIMARLVFQQTLRNPFMEHFDALWSLFWSGLQSSRVVVETDEGNPS